LREAKARELVSEDCELSTLLASLAEDNQRRIDAGRRPQFQCQEVANGKWELQLESQGLSSEEIQEGFARALHSKFENGRTLAAKSAMSLAVSRQKWEMQQSHLRAWARDERKAIWKFLRSYLAELDTCVFERTILKLLAAVRFREIKVAKRSKESVLLTARKREGSLDLRYTIRLLFGATVVDRKHIQTLRGDLHHHRATLGMLCSVGDLRGEARSEALLNGESLIMLWCGDALIEKFLETTLGVKKHVIEFFELDEAFFEKLQNEVASMNAKREARLRDRQLAFPTEPAEHVPVRDELDEGEGEASVVRRKKNRRRRKVRRLPPEATRALEADAQAVSAPENMFATPAERQADSLESGFAETSAGATDPPSQVPPSEET
jgi:hypothetical protein